MDEMITCSPEFIYETVSEIRDANYRLVQIHCTNVKVGNTDGYEMTYTFDKEYVLKQVRTIFSPNFVLNSVSSLYEFAFLYENEVKDLFGVNFRNLTIDFKGNLYQTALRSPMRNTEVDEVGK